MSRTDFTPDRIFDRPWGPMSYSTTGGGRPLVLIHGNGRNRHDWAPLHLPLRKRWLILPDLHGHGGSAVPRTATSLASMADDVFALTDHLWTGRFDLAGHSLGGMIALEILRRHPERVGKVALLEGWTSLHHARALTQDMLECMTDAEIRQVDHMLRDTYVRWMPGLRESFWQTVEAFSALDVLERTTHPVLELYGDRNRPPVDRVALGVPRRDPVELQWIPGAGHFLLMQAPEATAAHLQRFFLGDDDDEEPLPPATLQDLALRPGY